MTVVVTWDKRDRPLDPRTVVALDVAPLGESDDAPLAPAQTIVRSAAADAGRRGEVLGAGRTVEDPDDGP